jgi:hypothetical protein
MKTGQQYISVQCRGIFTGEIPGVNNDLFVSYGGGSLSVAPGDYQKVIHGRFLLLLYVTNIHNRISILFDGALTLQMNEWH